MPAGTVVFIPVESLADDIVGASAVAVNLRSLELLPVLEVGQTIDFGRTTSEFFPYRYTFLYEFALKSCPVLCRSFGGLNGEINLLSDFRPSFQTLDFHIVFVLAIGQTILRFHLVAYLVVAVILEAVAHTFAVIIHSVIDDVAVWMLLVEMPGYDKLGVFDSHLIHVFQRKLHHKIIVHALCIFRRIGQRDVSAPVSDPAVEMSLALKTINNISRRVGQQTFGIEQTCLFVFLFQREGILHAARKTAPFSYASNHTTTVCKAFLSLCSDL